MKIVNINISDIILDNNLFKLNYLPTQKNIIDIIIYKYNDTFILYNGFDIIGSTSMQTINCLLLENEFSIPDLIIKKIINVELSNNDLLLVEIIHKLSGLDIPESVIINLLSKYKIDFKEIRFYHLLWKYRHNIETLTIRYGIDKNFLYFIDTISDMDKELLLDLV